LWLWGIVLSAGRWSAGDDLGDWLVRSHPGRDAFGDQVAHVTPSRVNRAVCGRHALVFAERVADGDLAIEVGGGEGRGREPVSPPGPDVPDGDVRQTTPKNHTDENIRRIAGMNLLPISVSSFASVSSLARKFGSAEALSNNAVAWAFLSLPASTVLIRSHASHSFSKPSRRTSRERFRNFVAATSIASPTGSRTQ